MKQTVFKKNLYYETTVIPLKSSAEKDFLFPLNLGIGLVTPNPNHQVPNRLAGICQKV